MPRTNAQQRKRRDVVVSEEVTALVDRCKRLVSSAVSDFVSQGWQGSEFVVFLLNTTDPWVKGLERHIEGHPRQHGVACVLLPWSAASALLEELPIPTPIESPPPGWTTLIALVSSRSFSWLYFPCA